MFLTLCSTSANTLDQNRQSTLFLLQGLYLDSKESEKYIKCVLYDDIRVVIIVAQSNQVEMTLKYYLVDQEGTLGKKNPVAVCLPQMEHQI